jgi:sugar lactone lactonase YvrE
MKTGFRLLLFPLLGCLACTSALAPDKAKVQWPPEGVASPAVIHWVGEFSEIQAGGFSGFLRKVAGAEGEDSRLHFSRPVAVAVVRERVAVADTWSGSATISDLDGGDSRILKLPDGARPNSIAFARDGSSVVVGDGMTGGLLEVDLESGTFRTLLGGDVLDRCGGLVVTTSGEVVVTDPVASRVVAVSLDGKPMYSAGGVGEANTGIFNTPTALAEDPDGSLWMIDTFNFRVVHLSRELEILGSFGSHGDASGNFALPKGIAVDPDGHIYVSDAIFDVVQVFDSDGRLLLVIGGHGTGPGQFLNPAGMAFSADGTLLVADTGNARLQVFRYRSREGER